MELCWVFWQKKLPLHKPAHSFIPPNKMVKNAKTATWNYNKQHSSATGTEWCLRSSMTLTLDNNIFVRLLEFDQNSIWTLQKWQIYNFAWIFFYYIAPAHIFCACSDKISSQPVSELAPMFEACAEQLEFFIVTNGVTDFKKKKAVLLTNLPIETYQLAKDLMPPFC